MSRTTDLFKGLMFLEGHFTRPDDVEPVFSPLGNQAAGDRWLGPDSGAGRGEKAGLSLLQHLQFLGGRPMHAGHNLDVEEPFEQLPASRFTAPICDLATLRHGAACG